MTPSCQLNQAMLTRCAVLVLQGLARVAAVPAGLRQLQRLQKLSDMYMILSGKSVLPGMRQTPSAPDFPAVPEELLLTAKAAPQPMPVTMPKASYALCCKSTLYPRCAQSLCSCCEKAFSKPSSQCATAELGC